MKERYTDDPFQKKARQMGLRARSYFKLEEIDNKFHIIKKNSRILDLGAAPGSWSQYCLKNISEQAEIVAVDLQSIQSFNDSRVLCLQEDVFQLNSASLGTFDCILSDMAPKTSGIRSVDAESSLELCERALGLCADLLRPGGHFVCKLLQGADIRDFQQSMRQQFQKYSSFRPKSTRKNSSENFVVGFNLKLP